jgi:hypothetical protein
MKGKSHMVYRWASGSQFRIDANVAGERVEELMRTHGGKLKPKNVVEDARSSRSPLHRAFEWNDGTAAERYRESQAGLLLRSLITVVVNVSKPTEAPTHTRCIVNVREPKNLRDRTYRPLVHVLSDEELKAQLLETALYEFRVWRDKYRSLTELAELFAAGDAVIGRIPRAVKHTRRRAASGHRRIAAAA